MIYTENKPGVKTTEFWLALTGVGGLLVKFFTDNCSVDESKLIGLVVIIGGYIAGRSWVKSKEISARSTNTGSGNV